MSNLRPAISAAALLLQSDPTRINEYLSSRSKTLGFTSAALMKNDGSPIAVAQGSDDKLIARPEPSDFQDDLKVKRSAASSGSATFSSEMADSRR